MYHLTLQSGEKISVLNMLHVSPACQSLTKKELRYVKKEIKKLPESEQKKIADALLKEKDKMESLGRELDRTMLRMDVLQGMVEKMEKEEK